MPTHGDVMDALLERPMTTLELAYRVPERVGYAQRPDERERVRRALRLLERHGIVRSLEVSREKLWLLTVEAAAELREMA